MPPPDPPIPATRNFGRSSKCPSAVTSSKISRLPGAPLDRHLFGKANKGAADRHVRSSNGWLSKRPRDIGVGMPHFDPRDDRFTVPRSQALQRRLIPLERFAADRL